MIHNAIYKINHINKTNYFNTQQSNNSTGLKFSTITQDTVSFKSQIASEPILKELEGVASDIAVTSTGFFRDFKTLEAAKKEINKYFPEGCHIADFGCSSGEETKTLAMLLGPQYNIAGYDISENNIEKAKSGKHNILMRWPYDKNSQIELLKYGTDSYLGQERKEIDPEFRNYWDLFYQYFDKTGETEFFQKLFFYSVDAKHFQEKPGIFDDRVAFQIANIFDIDKMYEKSDPKLGAVFFQNALYHISGNIEPGKSKCNFDNLKTLAEKINTVLPINGIFVCGRNVKDHIYCNTDTLPAYSNPYKDSPLYKILEDAGFEPIPFYDLCVMTNKDKDIYVPAIWRKVREIPKNS